MSEYKYHYTQFHWQAESVCCDLFIKTNPQEAPGRVLTTLYITSPDVIFIVPDTLFLHLHYPKPQKNLSIFLNYYPYVDIKLSISLKHSHNMDYEHVYLL